MDSERFMRAVKATWIIGASIALLLVLDDMSRFNEAKSEGLVEIVDAADELDELYRDLLKVEATLPLGKSADSSEVDHFRERLTKWGGAVSDYRLPEFSRRSGFFSEAERTLEDSRGTLDNLRSKTSQLATLADRMIRNFDQARTYWIKSAIAEEEARRYRWNWDYNYRLLQEADSFARAANRAESKAAQAIAAVAERKREIRDIVGDARQNLSFSIRDSKEAAQMSYGEYLARKLSDFDPRREFDNFTKSVLYK